MLEDLRMEDGENVNLELDRQQRRVIITPVEKPIITVRREKHGTIIVQEE